jgi:hypothetical protein
MSALKRYGPFVVAVVLVVAAIAIFGGGSGGDDDNDSAGEESVSEFAQVSREDLVRSGPMTPEKADLLGKTGVDFGPSCDTETGKLKLPTIYAPPCVEPFEGDNGGASSVGVTADSVKIVAYRADPALDPIGSAMIEGLGANLDPQAGENTIRDYVAVYQQLFETYGRTVELETFTGTGSSDDLDAARADAIAIADKKPFAVIGSPLQAREVFAEELAARKVICFVGCGLALSDELIKDNFPYVWTTGPTTNQAVQLAAEAIGNLAGPGKAVLAGNDATKAKDRVYAAVHYDTPDGDHKGAYAQLVAGLEKQGITLATDVEYTLDPNRMQETAAAIIAKLQDAGVTTVIFYGDGLTPISMTQEATAQDFWPEWILGPNVLADASVAARQYDQEQWKHGFGMAFATTPGADEIGDSFIIYDWAYHRTPPSNIYQVLEPPIRALFTAIQMAGPELTPDSVRDGLFRIPPVGGGPTRPTLAFGDTDLWGDLDLGSLEDVSLIWWDTTAEGEDELGLNGKGLYRYANGGERYSLGEFPKTPEAAGLFDNTTGVIELTELPPEDRAPDYPSPQL